MGNHAVYFGMSLLLLLMVMSMGMASSSEEPATSCALLFFGLGRKFKEIAYPSIVENILAANPTCHVFIHTYNVTKAQGGRIGEDGTGSINVNELFMLVAPTDTSRMTIETEEDFQRQRKVDVEHYRSVFPKPSRWNYPTSMDNMVRQWHSIEKVWEKMEEFEESVLHARYDLVGLFRLDVQYTHPISVTDLGDNGVAVIPKFMYEPSQNDHSWGGYNDRMFYGKREYAKSWATERFNSVVDYLHWQTKNKNYVAKSGLHSEDFMRWLLVFQFPMPLTMKPICFKRIRSSGKIMEGDCNMLYKRHNVKQLQLPVDMVPQPEQNPSDQKGVERVLEEVHTYLLDRASHRICTIVRTHPGHANLLPITLLSLTQQSYQGEDVAMSIFVVNTDSIKFAQSNFMHAAAADANMKAGHKVVTVLDASFHEIPPKKAAFGYDATDRLLAHLLVPEDKHKCTHFLFTNGDNFYTRSFLEQIKPELALGKALIAWDFISHHKRANNVISVKFVRRFVDLGSVLVERAAIEMRKPHSQFLPEGIQTPELFARDFFFFKEIYDRVGEGRVGIIHQVLFAHQ